MNLSVALIQLNSGDDPSENLPVTEDLITRAAGLGAELVLTPEVTNIVSTSRKRQVEVLATEEADQTLWALATLTSELNIWLLIGSLALKSNDPGGRFVNRSFLINPTGRIVARYDKIHMFDVNVSSEESYLESAGYLAGDTAILAEAGFAKIGMTICYDLRFPHLYRALAHGGAQILTVPSAFSPVTGRAHWEALLRARAIESGCFVLAPAQTGTHAASLGKIRSTYGHSMVVDPWGKVLLDAGTEPGVFLVDLELDRVEAARKRIPSLSHDRDYQVNKDAQPRN